ncbi:MAG: aminotransferase class V-fold PLP-dependent enzyme [Luteitalea sp.]
MFAFEPGERYLNCAYMSPLAAPVEDAGRAGLARRRSPGQIGADAFFRDLDEVRAAFAAVLGAPAPEQVALLPSVSYGMGIVARNLPFREGQRIVVAGEQFPSNVHPWRRLCAERGGAVHAVAAPVALHGRAETWNAALLEAIDERTALLAIGHVHWADGTRFDLPALAARAREVGAWVVIDANQSVGAMDFPFEAVRPDAVVCAAYKWMFGPYGMAFGWFGAALQDGEPLEETWGGRLGSEDFRSLVAYSDTYGPGSARYDVGERANFVHLGMALAALRMVQGWGTARIQAYTGALWATVLPDLQAAGFSVEAPAWRGAHLVGLRPPASSDIATLAQRLTEARVSVSLRGSAIRVSPHLYNTPDDMRALLGALT